MLLLFFLFARTFSTETEKFESVSTERFLRGLLFPVDCPPEGYITYQGYKGSDVSDTFDLGRFYLEEEKVILDSPEHCLEACMKSKNCRYYQFSSGTCLGFKEDFRKSNLVQDELYTVVVPCFYLS